MAGRTVGDTEIQFAVFSVVFGGIGERRWGGGSNWTLACVW